MQFPDSWFEDEVREGFFIAAMMKRAWAAQMEALFDVAEVLRRHQITYYADFGTLLGAVRHRGFIPWDDDLDICMQRKDYNRFLAVADELPKGYFVRSIHTDPAYTEMFARVLNSREINFEAEFLEKFHGCPYGMGIDIFVLDHVAPTPGEEARQMQLINFVLDRIEQFEAGVLDERVWSMEKERIERELSAETDSGRPLKNQMLLLLEKVFSMYEDRDADEIAIMPLWMHERRCRMKKAWYRETTELPFETASIPAPAFYDAVLDVKYGEYMASRKIGGSHDYPLHRKQEEALKRQVGVNPYAYVIAEEDLKSDRTERKMTVKRRIRTCLQLLWKQQSMLEEEIRKNGWDTAQIQEILTECQETAIAFGTCVESVKGEGTETVAGLEAYCEEIFGIYEAVSGNETNVLQSDPDPLRRLLEQIASAAGKEIDLRYEAVFLPCRASEWDALESVYNAAKEDPECVAYVIPIPYCYKKSDGSFGEMRCEADQFPADVPVTDYRAFDYEGHCVDVMYVQNPYDAYHPAVSVHPFFYSENLKKYTDKLAYVPPFTVNEITSEDQRAIENLKYCCIAPGVVHADRVVVQSEEMRRIYIRILTEAAGEESRTIWEEKILGFGSPKTDQNAGRDKQEEKLPEEWSAMARKPDGSRKKIVLYVTGAAVFMERGEKALEKMKQVFDAFWERREEILLIWMPELKPECGRKEDPLLWEEYQKLMLRYMEKGVGILADSGDIKRAAAACDAYYGDRGYAAQLCIRKGVPAMLQEVEII